MSIFEAIASYGPHVVAAAAMFCAATPTPKIGSTWALVYKVIEILACNIGKAKQVGRLGLILIAVMLPLLSLSACTSTGSSGYQAPEICYLEDGSYVEDSLILEKIPEPMAAGLILQLANVEAIKRGAYSADEALAVIDRVDRALDSATTYAALCSYVIDVFDEANELAGVQVFVTSGYISVLNQDLPVSVCDVAILKRHVAKQRTAVEALE